MGIKFLHQRGALNESGPRPAPTAVCTSRVDLRDVNALLNGRIPTEIVELVPESVARENVVMPLAFDGETIVFAATDPENIAVADRLRFILAKNARLVAASKADIIAAINRNYGRAETESVDSMLQEFTDTDLDDADIISEMAAPPPPTPKARTWSGEQLRGFRNRKKALLGLDPTPNQGRTGMLFYVVEEGQRVLMRRRNGTMQVLVGPVMVWRGFRTFQPMAHHVAHPDQFLIVRYRDGRQEHIAGPADVWFDPRLHLEITREDALQLAAKEAVVVYSKEENGTLISRRIVYGPALFVPRPGEWLHTFSWHASRGGSEGAQKVAHALVFQKLWLMPDQMYHDVTDVRTADDAVLTIRLMIFFELVDIERMLNTTHDPIGDFVNAATSDVVGFTGKHDFEQFKRNTSQLNELETYPQLCGRAEQCGYRINKVVYRGYGAAAALQQMHDHAIEARTRLQLDRATEQQAQELENYKLESQLARAGKRRVEQTAEVEHDLTLAQKRQEAELRQKEALQTLVRGKHQHDADLELEIRRRHDDQQRQHLMALRELGVDLTAYLTQARADRVIELRSTAAGTHVHLDSSAGNGQEATGTKPVP